ncbi:MAG: hypothetical protein ACRESZ_00500 [Methylococcales bacterium]
MRSFLALRSKLSTRACRIARCRHRDHDPKGIQGFVTIHWSRPGAVHWLNTIFREMIGSVTGKAKVALATVMQSKRDGPNPNHSCIT